MKKYMGYRNVTPSTDGPDVPTTEGVSVHVVVGKRRRLLNPRLDIRNHSPGCSLMDMASIVVLDMAVGAKQLEPFRVLLDVAQSKVCRPLSALPAPLVLCGRIGVMEVQGRETAVIAATLATSAKSVFERDQAGTLVLSPSGLLALSARLLPALVSGVRERFPTFVAEPFSFQFHTRALMLALSREDLTAGGTAAFVEANKAIPCRAVSTIGDSPTASDAMQGRVGSHDSPTGLYVCGKYSIRSVDETEFNFEWGYGGSGPAQLALALVADCMGKRYAIAPIYQRVKAKIVAGLSHDGWTLDEETLRDAVAEAMAEADMTEADLKQNGR
jgi:hypothetical protein